MHRKENVSYIRSSRKQNRDSPYGGERQSKNGTISAATEVRAKSEVGKCTPPPPEHSESGREPCYLNYFRIQESRELAQLHSVILDKTHTCD